MKPRRTVESVVEELIEGLTSGEIVLEKGSDMTFLQDANGVYHPEGYRPWDGKQPEINSRRVVPHGDNATVVVQLGGNNQY